MSKEDGDAGSKTGTGLSHDDELTAGGICGDVFRPGGSQLKGYDDQLGEITIDGKVQVPPGQTYEV